MDESFLDLISKCQSHRLDDQRSDLPSPSTNRDSQHSCSEEDEALFDTLWRLQGARIEEQRCDMPVQRIEASSSSRHVWQEADKDCLSRDELFELIFNSQVRVVQCLN